MTTPINPTTIAVPSGRLAPGPRPVMTAAERLAAVTGHHVLVYRRTWRATIIERFLAPLMFLVSVGLGVGSLVDSGAGGIAGMSYLHYVAPGLVAMQAMWLAFGESTYVVMGYLKWNQMYSAMLASPLSVVEVLGGHVLVVALHLASASAIFIAMGGLFGAFTSWWAFAMVPAAAATGMAFSLPLFALAATTPDDSGFGVVNRLVLAPVVMVSGVFFPIESLPAVLQPIAWASPMYHGTELCREAATGNGSFGDVVPHVVVLAVWLVGGWLLARRQFTKRLVA